MLHPALIESCSSLRLRSEQTFRP